jgi:hypothetical protein
MKNWYLVVVQFAPTADILARLKTDYPAIESALKRLSSDECRLMMRSEAGHTVIWILHTSESARRIMQSVQNPAGRIGTTLTTDERFNLPPDSGRKNDKILITHLADDRSWQGMNVIESWVQRTS